MSTFNQINQCISAVAENVVSSSVVGSTTSSRTQSRPANMTVKQWYQYLLVKSAPYGTEGVEYIINTLEGTDSLCSL